MQRGERANVASPDRNEDEESVADEQRDGGEHADEVERFKNDVHAAFPADRKAIRGLRRAPSLQPGVAVLRSGDMLAPHVPLASRPQPSDLLAGAPRLAIEAGTLQGVLGRQLLIADIACGVAPLQDRWRRLAQQR